MRNNASGAYAHTVSTPIEYVRAGQVLRAYGYRWMVVANEFDPQGNAGNQPRYVLDLTAAGGAPEGHADNMNIVRAPGACVEIEYDAPLLPGDRVKTSHAGCTGCVVQVYADYSVCVAWDDGEPQAEGLDDERLPPYLLERITPSGTDAPALIATEDARLLYRALDAILRENGADLPPRLQRMAEEALEHADAPRRIGGEA